jgi:poly-beta-1,6-N-acetyl-D-glucosamine synthase
MTESLTYILITPARNEEKYIEKTLQSVAAQSVLPAVWVIVSDGSTDRTDEIVQAYAQKFSFIKLLRRPPDATRNFGSKAAAIRAGLDGLETRAYDFIGFLDADISFEPDFFKKLLQKMEQAPGQGIGGGVIYEHDGNAWTAMPASFDWSVAGALQFFRRKCYEDIGGYRPLPKGGIDMLAEVMARMHGWSVKTFEDLQVYHYRRMGAEKGNLLHALFKRGIEEYVNGYHPLFQVFRFFSWLPQRPCVLGSCARTLGYFQALLQHTPLCVPDDVKAYLRKEQLLRLKNIYLRTSR